MQLNFTFVAEYLPWYIEAAKLTVRIAFWGVLFSLLIGVVCSVLQYYRVPVIRRIISVYIEISRNTPLLVQLFFLYFGLPKIGVILSAETCASSGWLFSAAAIWRNPCAAAWNPLKKHSSSPPPAWVWAAR